MATNLAQTLKGCRSWADLQQRWSPLTKKQKGDLFEELTKHYLCLEPEYATKLKFVWLLREVPRSLAKRLKLPSGDQGIDLVAETKDGEYWAIQSKYRQESDQSITWREISTFTGLAFGVCREFSYGLIASTTERITNVLKHQDRIGFAALDVWQGLDEEFFKRLQNHLYHKREVLKPRLPRPHQKKAIADAFTYFVKNKHKRGKLIMPCGTGKSLTSYFIAQKIDARKIVIAVPSLSLIKQTLKAWMYESMARKQDVEWICVCSDESAGKVEQDDAVVLKQDLGVPCLTNSKEIAQWLKRKHNSLSIVFTTYQSGQALAKAARSAGFTFDLGIMDEAHKTAGSKGRVFSHLVLNKNVKISRRLFMTATERRYQGQSDEVLSMEDPDDYGETIHKLSFKKALEYKPAILSDYKVVTIHISQEEIADLVRNRDFVRPKTKGWNKEMEAENLAALIALRKAMNKYPIRHAVSFHGSIKRAQDFQENNDAYSKSFPSRGRLQTFHVSGKTPTGTRAKEIDQFSKAPRSLITNARCLNEGVDVPNIDAVLFADPRKSLVDIVQAVGRALRPSPDKKFGYVIVPVVHKKNAKADDIFDSDSFKEVLTTLRALGSQDDRIIEYFRAVSQGRHPKGRRPFEGVLTEILAKKIDLKEFARSVELRCWDRLAKLSWRPFKEARKFVRSLGLKNFEEWSKAYKKGAIPSDIPAAPWGVYENSGWITMGDWLGTGSIATQNRVYIDYKKAEKIVRKLRLKSQIEWYNIFRNRHKRPAVLVGIPNGPDSVYKGKGWKTWNEWLGTKPKGNRKFLSFVKARAVIRKLKFKSQKEFFSFCRGRDPLGRKLPINIPATPHGTYKSSGWKGYGDWLGTGIKGTRERPFWSYEKCSAFMKSKAFTKQDDFIEFSKSQIYRTKYINYIPYNPQKVFAKKWKGWGKYLKTGNVATYKRKYLPFTAARKLVRKVGFKTIKEWRMACRGILLNQGRIPTNVPANPGSVYHNKGWRGFGDWLGTGNLSPLRKLCSYSEAKQWAIKNNIQSGKQWNERTRKLGDEFPQNIPRVPPNAYKGKGWRGWPSFLSSNKWNPLRKICSYAEAKKFARKNKIITCTQWMRFLKAKGNKSCRKIPRAPDQVYIGKGWKSWPNFLGTDQKK